MPATMLLAAVAAAATPAAPPKGPAEAIAIADAHPGRGTTGLYEMTVARTERTLKAVFLNSDADYRSPGNVTFSISLPAARILTKRYGEKPEDYLKGHHVVVRGAIQAHPIVNLVAGRPHSLARYQHTVEVRTADQIVSVD